MAFGKAKAGDPIKYSYVFTNTGDAVLEVSHVQPSCGCTTAGDWTRKVEPGQTGIVPVQLNSGAIPAGGVFKTITVTSTRVAAMSAANPPPPWSPIQFHVPAMSPSGSRSLVIARFFLQRWFLFDVSRAVQVSTIGLRFGHFRNLSQFGQIARGRGWHGPNG